MQSNSVTILITERQGDSERSIEIATGAVHLGAFGLTERRRFSDKEICQNFSVPMSALEPRSRFQKLDSNLKPVGPDADAWTCTRDSTTGLIWSANNILAKSVPWAKADKACRELGDGWRLPTRGELLTLIDDTKHNPCIDTDYFRDVKAEWYWTSTPAAWSADCAWIVYFSYGLAGSTHRSLGAFVRAVRSAVPAGQ